VVSGDNSRDVVDSPAGTGARPMRRPVLSIVFAYYENPQMLALQCERLAALPKSVLSQIEVIVVDDSSPRHPAVAVIPEKFPVTLAIFRIDTDKPWNQDAARNIGAWEARGTLLLLTDIDHVVPRATVEALLKDADTHEVFSLGRGAHFSAAIVAPHVNSYVMSRETYWDIGGYDEDFWGMYGSDWLFRRRVLAARPIVLRDDLTLELVTQGSVPDAKNTVFSRRPSVARRILGLALRALKALRLIPSPRVMSNPYRRVYPVGQHT
jgi:hypothetical protein